ncbi:MAG: oxidoreductase [Nitrospira bacterium SG8_3]|nr:MAG: oxidoreductase [Nitrospira bacterium SG8_3]
MKKYNMIIDVAKCHDCNNCFLACKDEYIENDFLPISIAQPWHGHRWMDIMRKERGQYPQVDVAYRPTPCMHCDDAPCMNVCKEGTVYKREDGVVIIDPEKARGEKGLMKACPYGAIWWNEEKEVPQKCTFCAHLLDDGWAEPRCVQACPTGALKVVHTEDAEMKKIIASEDLEIYLPETKTNPRVYYKNLYRFTTSFIAGSIALQDTDECAEGAKINLRKGSKSLVSNLVTNNYGDFKLDKLPEESGDYTLEIAYEGYQSKSLTVNLEKSINLGTIFLAPS